MGECTVSEACSSSPTTTTGRFDAGQLKAGHYDADQLLAAGFDATTLLNPGGLEGLSAAEL